MNATRRPTVLVGEDDPADQELIRRALDEHPIAIEMVGDGVAMMNHLRRVVADQLPDMILLDLNMPRLTGKEVLVRIKADPALCNIPVVVFSSSNRRDDVRECYRAGCASYVVKPTDFEPFASALKQLTAYWLDLVESPQPAV